MAVFSERIKPTDYSIHSFLEDLTKKKYQIPTFQREVVWSQDSVKKLWDSICRFYPIGSILIWKTDLRLQNHRQIGGHVIAETNQSGEYSYILDGQQRTTSLLTSLYGGEIEGRKGFNPSLFIDLTVQEPEEDDEGLYRQRFLFWTEIDDRGGSYGPNSQKMKKYQQGLIAPLRDVMLSYGAVEKKLHDAGLTEYENPVRTRLREIHDVLNNYRISFIELRGIEVAEVCQIFERINQEGKPLDIFDIVVAKTYRLPANGTPGFYLRDLLNNFRESTGGQYKDIPEIWYLEMLATLIMFNIKDVAIHNITPAYLNRIKTEHIESVWDEGQRAVRKLFDFFDNHLHLKGPRLIPNRYFFQAMIAYLYNNKAPNYDRMKEFFWFVSFHNDDLMNSTTSLVKYAGLLHKAKNGENYDLGRFVIDRQRLREASYNSKGRLSTAILALLSNERPGDWLAPDKQVINDVYYQLSDKPNLHHIFPVGYIAKYPGKNKINVNSLMNIAYIPQIENIKISDRNPVDYLRDYDKGDFERTLSGHLIPLNLLEWARQDRLPENALDVFVEKRVESFLAAIKDRLRAFVVDVVDTGAKQSKDQDTTTESNM